MSENEIRQEIENLKEEIAGLQKELSAKLDVLKQNLIKWTKALAIGIGGIIGLRLTLRILGYVLGTLWRHKKGLLFLGTPALTFFIYSKTSQKP